MAGPRSDMPDDDVDDDLPNIGSSTSTPPPPRPLSRQMKVALKSPLGTLHLRSPAVRSQGTDCAGAAVRAARRGCWTTTRAGLRHTAPSLRSAMANAEAIQADATKPLAAGVMLASK